MHRCRITPPSLRIGTAGSARATPSANSSRAFCADACQRAWFGGEGFAVDASFIRADANRVRGVERGQVPKWEDPSRAVREYLEGVEATNPVASDDTELPSVRNISLTDPAAHWTAAPGGPPQYAYSTNSHSANRPTQVRPKRSVRSSPSRTQSPGASQRSSSLPLST